MDNFATWARDNYMMFNPLFEEVYKKTFTSGDELKNSEGLERYLAKLSTNFSWYFDFGATRHVTAVVT
jgi:hypothetical protein